MSRRSASALAALAAVLLLPRATPRPSSTIPTVLAVANASVAIDREGARLEVAGRSFTLDAVALGRGDQLRRLSTGATPVTVAGEVRVDRGDGVVEWWRAIPLGLEHGLTLAARPRGEGPLRIELAVGGEVHSAALNDDAVELRDEDGRIVGRYAALVVIDARGARVPARMEARDEGIDLLVSDADADYPLWVDPIVTAEEATLVPSVTSSTEDSFGSAVAISPDGTRVIVGTPNADTDRGMSSGSAHIFRRDGGGWVQEATLLPSELHTNAGFGCSVAFSADASRAIVGAYYENVGAPNVGTARVFSRTGTTWRQEALLLAPDGETHDVIGYSVLLAPDASFALVATPNDTTATGPGAGSVRTFLRSGTRWRYDSILLEPESTTQGFGFSMALSADGNVLLVGAIWDDEVAPDAGSARVFVRSGSGWAREAILRPPETEANDHIGQSTSLSADGSRALVGMASNTRGAAYVFARTGPTWALEGTLSAALPVMTSYAANVAMTADGSVALVGAVSDDFAGPNTGGAHVFARAGAVWSEAGRLHAADAEAGDLFGAAIALAADGSRALVGAPGDDVGGIVDGGSVRVFAALVEDGSPCDGGSTCESGFCVDGVCCSSACGGGSTSDCRACASPLTGQPDGVCAPLSSAAAPSTACRPSVGPCDAEEVCSSSSEECPPDRFASGAVCRAVAGPCDVEETCGGTGPLCPDDGFRSGEVCREAIDLCDADDLCDGDGPTCSVRFSPAGTECRAAATPCDIAEACDGTSERCPADMSNCGVDGGGMVIDGGSEGDAAMPDPMDGGVPSAPVPSSCACRVTFRASSPALGLLFLIGSTFAARRRRR